MADEIDLANELIDNEVSRALSKIRQRTQKMAKGRKNCIECDDLLPVERQDWGYDMCVKCAEDAEKKGSMFAD